MRRPHSVLKSTPFEAKNLCKPFVNHLRIIGSRAWFIEGKLSKKKPREDQVTNGRLIGYEGNHIYRILTDDGRICKAHSVHITEKRPASVQEESLEFNSSTHPDVLLHPTPLKPLSPPRKRLIPTTASKAPNKRARITQITDENDTEDPTRLLLHEIQPIAQPQPTVEIPPLTIRPEEFIPVSSTAPSTETTHSRESTPYSKGPIDGHPDLDYPDPDSLDPISLMALLAKQDTSPKSRNDPKLNQLLGLIAKISLSEANSPEPFEPRHFKEAMSDPDSDKWMGAMKEEFSSLQENKTWILVDRPSDRRVLPSKWVYKHKRGPEGQIIRYKARWVVRGDQ